MEGRIHKQCHSKSEDPLAGYIDEFSYWAMEELNETIDEIEKAIIGQFSQIDDPYIGMEFWNIEITPNGVEAYREDPPYSLVETFALSDFKDLLIAWKAFLLTPPLDGTKVR